MSETNTTEDKKPTYLETLHTKYVEGGSKTPDPKHAKGLIEKWRKAAAAKDAAETALAEARKAESEAVEAIVLARGKGRFKLADGTQLTPMGKDAGGLFMRRDGGNDLATFG